MTDSAEAGSVAETPAGNPQSATPPMDNGSAGGGGSWLDGLSEGNRKVATAKGWDKDGGLDKAFSSYSELEKQLGTSIRLPKDDATPEEWNTLYDKLGRPKEPVYDFKLPADYPADLPYDDALAKAMMPILHEAGASQKQAQAFHDGYAKLKAEEAKAYQQAVASRVMETYDALTKDYGPKDEPRFKEAEEFANRFVKKFGLADSFKTAGIILPDGTLTDPAIFKAFEIAGKAMFREDTLNFGNVPKEGNPWKAGTTNVSQQNAIQKRDPALARRLKQEAGVKPTKHGLT